MNKPNCASNTCSTAEFIHTVELWKHNFAFTVLMIRVISESTSFIVLSRSFILILKCTLQHVFHEFHLTPSHKTNVSSYRTTQLSFHRTRVTWVSPYSIAQNKCFILQDNTIIIPQNTRYVSFTLLHRTKQMFHLTGHKFHLVERVTREPVLDFGGTVAHFVFFCAVGAILIIAEDIRQTVVPYWARACISENLCVYVCLPLYDI